MQETGQIQKQGIFYGWYVVAACFILTATLGETLFSFGMFFKPLESEFGWSRSLVSLGNTAFIIGFSISVAISGRLADRQSPRFLLICSAALVGIGLTTCYFINDIYQLSIFLFIAGLGSGATFTVPATAVQRWFSGRKKAGTALAIVVSGVGVGQMFFTQLINLFIVNHGWRNAFLITGVLFFCIIVLSSLVIRRSPISAKGGPTGKGRSEAAGGWSTSRAIVTPGYIAIGYALCAVLFSVQVVSVHLVPHAVDLGLSTTEAAGALGLLGGLTIPGRLISGYISSRLNWQKTMGLSLCAMGACMVWLLFVTNSWMLFAFVFFFGFFWGIRTVAQLGIISEFFGLRSVGELIGITSCAANLVTAAAPYIAGYIFDTTGSYTAAFAIIAALVLSGGAAIMLVKRPQI